MSAASLAPIPVALLDALSPAPAPEAPAPPAARPHEHLRGPICDVIIGLYEAANARPNRDRDTRILTHAAEALWIARDVLGLGWDA